ncbi:MAG: LysR family transcriptional regulator [Pseudomonadota bacterium]
MTYPNLNVGAQVHRDIVIDPTRTIDFLGEQLRIYATPELVRDIELTCLDFLLPSLAAGENSVGTALDIRHTGATLMGMSVRISATISHIDRRSITFDVSASDGVEEVCTGTHSRFIVDVDKLRGKVEQKAQLVARGSAAAA